ncbi:hypothetical protein ACFL29_01135 [Patescibacteria group bacterium]
MSVIKIAPDGDEKKENFQYPGVDDEETDPDEKPEDEPQEPQKKEDVPEPQIQLPVSIL